METEDVCFIDSGITNLSDVHLKQSLRVVNLHCNKISILTGLSHLAHLCHLDLSSNHIQNLQGLDKLLSLRTLNLSCNNIKRVQGLENLKSLIKINLSFNWIEDVSGFSDFKGASYQLRHVELQGNRITSIPHLVSNLQKCVTLQELVIAQGRVDNPICHVSGCRETILSGLPQLQFLDGADRWGQTIKKDNKLEDIPGLDHIMEFLSCSESTIDPNPIAVATPKIDTALELFRMRDVTSPETTPLPSSEIDTSAVEGLNLSASLPLQQQHPTPKTKPDHEIRLEKLESQLANLLYGGKVNPKPSQTSDAKSTKVSKHRAKRDIDITDDSDESSSSHRELSRPSRYSNKFEKGSTSGRKSKTAAARGKSKLSSTSTYGKKPDVHKEANKNTAGNSAANPPRISPDNRAPGRNREDKEGRDNARDTYVHLMHEVESERERRWKAEQATKRLIDHIKSLQSEARDTLTTQETTTEVTRRLKEAFYNEREKTQRLQDQLTATKDELSGAQEDRDTARQQEADNRQTLQQLQDNLNDQQREQLRQQAHQAKQVQESQLRAAATSREVELVRAQNKTLKGQVQQLQDLLATREQEHRKDLSERYSLDSPELQLKIQREVDIAKSSHTQQLQQQQQRIDSLTKQYSELEDEFRLALQIEANRFSELQQAFKQTSQEGADNRQALMSAQRKDEASSGMITELTALVKEQKGRITELSRSKQEQTRELKERVSGLEAHLEEARRRMLHLEMLKQDKKKHESQIQALESMVEGLKAERKLWGEELAQQGVGLAQDRGRLEVKIEAQVAEISSLKKQLERETDAVRIKTKMIEDQTESIKKLREGISERDHDLKKTREESIHIQRQLEEQLAVETSANQDLQERVERGQQRRQELKQQLEDVQEQMEETKRTHSALNNKWKDKAEMIKHLEQQVTDMKGRWKAKEQSLTEERNRAVEAASLAVDKLKKMDDAFCTQLDGKLQAHQQELARQQADMQVQVDRANNKVLEVEEEMRELLKETDASKRAMEQRFRKLTSAFSELQQDL